jgi:hypothetical protein
VGDDVASAIYSSLPLLESAVDLHHGVPVPVRVDRIFRSKLNAFQVQVQRIRKGDGYEGTRSSWLHEEMIWKVFVLENVGIKADRMVGSVWKVDVLDNVGVGLGVGEQWVLGNTGPQGLARIAWLFA